jgi:hypothetical protein
LRKTTGELWVIKQPNKALSNIVFSSHVRREHMLECHDRKNHEDKTTESVLDGLLYAHECALLVNFCIHDTKKISVDALGTLRNTGIHALVNTKCGTSWVTSGTKFEYGDSSLK